MGLIRRCLIVLLACAGALCGAPAAVAGDLSIVSADMTVTVMGGRGWGRCTAVLEKAGTQPATVSLFAVPVTPSALTLSPGLALLPARGLDASVAAAGTYRAEVSFLLPVENRDGMRTLTVPVPQSASSALRLLLPQENVLVLGDVALQTAHSEQGTAVTIYPGGRTSVRLTLSPGVARTDGEIRLATQVSGELRWLGGELRYAAEYRCERLGGRPGALTLRLPGGWVLDSITGADVLGWEPLSLPVASSKPAARSAPAASLTSRGAAPGIVSGVSNAADVSDATGATNAERVGDLSAGGVAAADGRGDAAALRELPGAYRVRYQGDGALTFSVVCSLPAGFGEQRLGLELPMPQEAVRASGTVAIVSTDESALTAQELVGAQPGAAGLSLTAPEVRFTLASRPKRFAYDCTLQTSSRLSEHVLTLRGKLGILVREGGRYRLSLRANPGLRLVSLNGASGLRWTQQGQDVVVESPARIDGRLMLEFAAEQNPEGEGASGSFELPWLLPVDPGSQNVLAAFAAPEGMEIQRAGDAGRMTQTAVAGLPEWMQPAQFALSGERAIGGVRVSLRRLPPAVEATAVTQLRLEDERAQMRTDVFVTPRRTAVFRHRILLGQGWDVTAVLGDQVRDWEYDAQAGVVTVSLNRASSAESGVQIRAGRALKSDARTISLPMPAYEGATLMRGFASLSASAGWELTPGEAAGVRPCARQEVLALEKQYPHAAGGVWLAYASASQTATVQRRLVPAEVRVRQTMNAVFAPGMVRFESRLDFTVAHGGVQELRFVPPAGFRNIEILSAPGAEGIGRFRAEDVRAEENGAYRVSFPARLDRVPPVIVRGERALPADGALTLAPVRLPGCERNAGVLTVLKPAGESGSAIEVKEESRDGMERQMRADDPSAGGLSRIGGYGFETDAATVGFRVLGTGSRIMQAARAGRCELVSRLTDSGDLLTRLRCRIENPGGQQFLSVTMPQGSRAWGAFSDGTPVKPVQDRTHLLIPLESGKKAFDLDLVYEQKLPGKDFGVARLELELPALSVPGAGQGMQVDRTDWRLWVPEDYDLISHGGTLNLAAGRQAGGSYLVAFVRDLAVGLLSVTQDMGRKAFRWSMWLLVRLVPLALVLLLGWIVVRAVRGGGEGRFGRVLLGGFLIVGIILIALAMLSAPLMNARSLSLKSASVSNLVQIGKAIYMYSSPSYYGTHPASIDNLFAAGLLDSPKIVTIPEGGSYAYAGVPENASGADIIAVELLDDPSGGNAAALYLDGHVKRLKNDEIVAALQQSRNHELLNQFMDNWQREEYAKKQKGVFGSKGKKMASLSREAEGLQLAQQELLMNKDGDTLSEPGGAQQRLNRVPQNSYSLSQEEAARQDVRQDTQKFNVRNFLRRGAEAPQAIQAEPAAEQSGGVPKLTDVPYVGRLYSKKTERTHVPPPPAPAGSDSQFANMGNELSEQKEEEIRVDTTTEVLLKSEVTDESQEITKQSETPFEAPQSGEGRMNVDALKRARESKMANTVGTAPNVKRDISRGKGDAPAAAVSTLSPAKTPQPATTKGTGDEVMIPQLPDSNEIVPESKPIAKEKPGNDQDAGFQKNLEKGRDAAMETIQRSAVAIQSPPNPARFPAEWSEMGEDGVGVASGKRVQNKGDLRNLDYFESGTVEVGKIKEDGAACTKDRIVDGREATDQSHLVPGRSKSIMQSQQAAGGEATAQMRLNVPHPAGERASGQMAEGGAFVPQSATVALGGKMPISFSSRSQVFFAGTSAGSLPIKVEIPENGRLLAFSRGAASDGGAVRVCFLSRGMIIGLELLVALGLGGGLYWLRHRRPGLLVPVCAAGLLAGLLALQWTQGSFRPPLIDAIAVLLIALAVGLLPWLLRPARALLLRCAGIWFARRARARSHR